MASIKPDMYVLYGKFEKNRFQLISIDTKMLYFFTQVAKTSLSL